MRFRGFGEDVDETHRAAQHDQEEGEQRKEVPGVGGSVDAADGIGEGVCVGGTPHHCELHLCHRLAIG